MCWILPIAISKTQPWARVYLSISFYSHSRVHFFQLRMRCVEVYEWVLVSLEWQLHNRIIMVAKCEFRYNCGMNFSNSMQQSLKVSFLWGGVISCYCQTTTWNIQIVLLLPTIFHCCNCFHTSNYITVCNRCWIYDCLVFDQSCRHETSDFPMCFEHVRRSELIERFYRKIFDGMKRTII